MNLKLKKIMDKQYLIIGIISLFFLIVILPIIIGYWEQIELFTTKPSQEDANWWNKVNKEIIGDQLKISYENKAVYVRPYFVKDGKNYTWGEVKVFYPEISLGIYKEDRGYEIKWGVTIHNPLNRSFNYIDLKIANVTGLAWDDVKRIGYKIIIKDKLVFDFSDIPEQGFKLTRPEKRIMRISNFPDLSLIEIDPTISYYPNSTKSYAYKGIIPNVTNPFPLRLRDYLDTKYTVAELNKTSYDDNGSVIMSPFEGSSCSGITTSSCNNYNGAEAGCNIHHQCTGTDCNVCLWVSGPDICVSDAPCGGPAGNQFVFFVNKSRDTIESIHVRLVSKGESSIDNVLFFLWNFLTGDFKQFDINYCVNDVSEGIKCNLTADTTFIKRFINESGHLIVGTSVEKPSSSRVYYVEVNVTYGEIPPWFYNITTNQTPVYINMPTNFTVIVEDDVKVEHTWLSHNFDITETSYLQNQSYSQLTYSFGKTYWETESFQFPLPVYINQVCIRTKKRYTAGAQEVNLSLYDSIGDKPTGGVLSATSIPQSSITTFRGWFCANYTTPYLISANKPYNLVVDSRNSYYNSQYETLVGNDNYYPNGRWARSSNNGVSWTLQSINYDMIFKIYGSTSGSGWKNETFIYTNAKTKGASQIVTPTVAGDFQYRWWANDSGRIGHSDIINLKVYPSTFSDTTMPQGSILSPPNNSIVNYIVTLKGTATDNNAIDYAKFIYSNKTSGWKNITGCSYLHSPYDCEWNTDEERAISEGYNVRIVPCDTSKNCNYTTQPKHYSIDRDVPIVIYENVKYPKTQSSAKTGNKVILELNVTDSAPSPGINVTMANISYLNNTKKLVRMHFDKDVGSLLAGKFSWWNLSVSVTATTSGNTLIPYYVRDNSTVANNIYSDTFIVLLDNTKPHYNSSLYGHSPSGPIYTNTNVTFQVKCSENNNLSHYNFASNFSGAWYNKTYNFSIGGISDWASHTQNITTGGYKYYFVIFDDAGNLNQTSQRGLTILSGSANITVTLISPSDKTNYTTLNMTFAYNYTGNVVSSCSLSFNNGTVNYPYNLTTSSPPSDTTLYFYKNLTNGTYTCHITCNDSNQYMFQSLEHLFNISTQKVSGQISLTRGVTQKLGTNLISGRIGAFFKSLFQKLNLKNLTDKIGGLFKNIIQKLSIKQLLKRTQSIIRKTIQKLDISDLFSTIKGALRNILQKLSIKSIVERLGWFKRIITQIINFFAQFLIPEAVSEVPSGGGGGGGGGGYFPKNKICEIIYYSLLEKPTNHTSEDIDNLKIKIENKTGYIMTIDAIKNYIYYFDYYCGEFNLTKPRPPVLPFNITFITGKLANCTTYLNLSIWGFPLDLSLNIPDIYVGDLTCNSVNFWRWTFWIEETTENKFYIKGIRIYLLIFLILVISIFIAVRIRLKRQKKKAETLIKKLGIIT